MLPNNNHDDIFNVKWSLQNIACFFLDIVLQLCTGIDDETATRRVVHVGVSR